MDVRHLGIGVALAALTLGGCASTAGSDRSARAAPGADQQRDEAARAASNAGSSQGSAESDRQASASTAQPVPGAQGSVGTGGASGQVGAGAGSTGTAGTVSGPAAGGTASGSYGTGSSAATGSATSPDNGTPQEEDAQTAQRHQLLFGSTERYQVSGRLASVNAEKGEITIQRQGLPPALLKVEPQTRIQLNGSQSMLGELKPGGDVRASFNLSGRRPIALEVQETGR